MVGEQVALTRYSLRSSILNHEQTRRPRAVTGRRNTRSFWDEKDYGFWDRPALGIDSEPIPWATRCFLRPLLPALKGKVVLDLGCGPGLLTPYLAAAADRVVAIDFSATAIAAARARCASIANVSFFEGDALEWTHDGKFDVITGRMFLHEVMHEDTPRFLDRLDALLASGGFLYLHENSYYNPIARFVRRRLVGKYGIPKHGSDEPRVGRLPGRPELVRRGGFLTYLSNYRQGAKADIPELIRRGGATTTSDIRTIVDDYLKTVLGSAGIGREFGNYVVWAYEGLGPIAMQRPDISSTSLPCDIPVELKNSAATRSVSQAMPRLSGGSSRCEMGETTPLAHTLKIVGTDIPAGVDAWIYAVRPGGTAAFLSPLATGQSKE